MFVQVLYFDPREGGHIPNLCLDNVRRGYGIDNKYGSAWEAWRHTVQHTDRDMPDGLAVPLFYSYSTTIDGVAANYGHINVRLPNGSVWSDGNIYTSIDDYTSKKSPKFVGWGESVNDFQIVKQGEDMPELINEDTSRILINGIVGYNGVAGRPQALDGSDLTKSLVGRPLTNDIIQDLYTGETAVKWRTSAEPTSIPWINEQLTTKGATPKVTVNDKEYVPKG